MSESNEKKKQPEVKGGTKAKANREPVSASKIFATVIIVIIVVALLGTSIFYVILPRIEKKNQIVFGSYDGEDIVLEQNSIIYEQYTQLANSNTDLANSADLSSQYQLWNQAYSNAVIITAATQMANRSGVKVPQELIDQAIIKSGYFADEEGNTFSADVYNNAGNDVRTSVSNYYKRMLPFDIVYNDQATTFTPQGELDFVGAQAARTRTFSYITVDYRSIPDTAAEAYLNADPAKFKSIDISILTTSTEDNAKLAYQALSDGTAWADVVAQYSEDSYAENGGAVGVVYYYGMSSILSDEQVQALYATAEGSFTEVMDTSAGYRIFKVDGAAQDADITDENTRMNIKYYMASYEADAVSAIIGDAAVNVANIAQTDFDKAAADYNLTVSTVGATPANIGGSQYMSSFSYTDSDGVLANYINEDLMKTLYTEEVGFVTNAIQNSDGSYMVIKITGEDEDASAAQTVALFYAYYGGQNLVSDFFYSVLYSDKHENNFLSTFLSLYMGN